MAGVRELGLVGKGGTDIAKIIDEINHGRIKVLYVLDQAIEVTSELEKALGKLDALIVHAWNPTPIAQAADIVLATSTYAEKEGTFVKTKGMVQHFVPAIVTQENERIMGMRMSRLDKFGAYNDRWTHGGRRDCRPAWQSMQGVAKLLGAAWRYNWPEDIFEEITQKVSSFRNMTYEQLDEYHGVELGKGDRPTPHGFTYTPHEFRPQIMANEKV
jgi:predicted molibdopterin-dependent oxidoreductase YjgC